MTRSLIGTTLLVAGVAGFVVAQEPPAILHEYFTYAITGTIAPDDDSAPIPEPGRVDPIAGNEGAGDPGTIGPGGIRLPGGTPDDQRNGSAAGQQDVPLDLDTEKEGMLRYVAVFTPEVAPWKRTGARDRVVFGDSGPELSVRDPSPRRVPIDGDDLRAGEEEFVGTMPIDTRAGLRIPIPSVAPGMRILDVVTEPPTTVAFEVDSTDTWFLRATEPGRFDVRFRVAARSTYFAGVPADALPASIDPTRVAPELVRRDAQRVAQAAGVRPGMDREDALRRLIDWFRAFEARPFDPTAATGNDFLDIALGQVGVCRHRAQTFTITALALGYDVRYVYNEAHAFTEVRYAELGWVRVDLGGASEGMELLDDADRPMHRPTDPWSSGQSFISRRTSLGSPPAPPGDPAAQSAEDANPPGQATGDPTTAPSTSGAPSPQGSPPGSSTGSSPGGATTPATDDPSAAASGAHGATGTPPARPRVIEMDGATIRAGEPITAPGTTGAEAPAPTSISLSGLPPRAYRGERFETWGRLDAGGAPVGGKRVRLVAESPDGQQVPLGEGITANDGSWRIQARIADTWPTGPWDVHVVWEGSPDLMPCRSD